MKKRYFLHKRSKTCDKERVSISPHIVIMKGNVEVDYLFLEEIIENPLGSQIHDLITISVKTLTLMGIRLSDNLGKMLESDDKVTREMALSIICKKYGIKEEKIF